MFETKLPFLFDTFSVIRWIKKYNNDIKNEGGGESVNINCGYGRDLYVN